MQLDILLVMIMIEYLVLILLILTLLNMEIVFGELSVTRL